MWSKKTEIRQPSVFSFSSKKPFPQQKKAWLLSCNLALFQGQFTFHAALNPAESPPWGAPGIEAGLSSFCKHSKGNAPCWERGGIGGESICCQGSFNLVWMPINLIYISAWKMSLNYTTTGKRPGAQVNKLHLYWHNMESQTNQILIKCLPVLGATPCRNPVEIRSV